MNTKKGFNSVPITEIVFDGLEREFSFLTVKGEITTKYKNKSKKLLTKTRNNLIKKLEKGVKDDFKKQIPTNAIKILKKSIEEKPQKIFKKPVKSGNIELLQLRSKVILEARLKGLSDAEIKSLISEEFDISPQHVSTEILRVEQEIRQCAIVSHEEILLSHTARYEHLYGRFREENIDQYALKALKCKEDIVGLHNQTVNIQINNYIDNDFDIGFLPKEKQQRLKELLTKVKVR